MYHGDSRAMGTSKAGAGINQAQALEYFEQFINATTLKNILGYFRTMLDLLHLKPTYYPLFYPKLKAMLNSWKAKAIWKKLDSRANHKCYGKGKIGEKTRMLVIGGGPCGLRTAIEAQLLGCKVVVVEKRDRLSRNNVLHLWPFVIEDLRALGAKKFFGKFCAGAIDHISIRQLQCILLKVALILGVEVHTEVSFEGLIEPNHDEKIGWRAQLKPASHPVSQYEFDVIIGADGKRNTLTGFKRKEFRGKLAIAITANFINKRSEAEARVEEISGVAFIFNQKFFKDLYHDTGIDLENIVYYKDETHYFVMTAKKPSLIEKGVILQDLADTERLLAPDNVNREALLNYAKEAADFSTNYQMSSSMEFAVNHYGQPDVAMFDFTSMYAAENASKVLERNGYQLLTILVGDSLLEPFWPTGSGCARGFLSSLDAAWATRSWSLGKASPLEVLAERESIYRLLAQTTPDNLNKDWKSYTLDPVTRYPNLNRATVSPHQLVSLYDTDDIQNIEKLGRNLENVTNISRKRRREIVDSEILIEWVKNQVRSHPSIEITDLSSIFHSGKVLCAIINHYRPDLIDYSSIVNNEATHNNQLAIDVLEKDIGIPPIMTGQEITTTQDNLALTAYLTQIYDVFRTEIPHVKHPKLELPESKNTVTSFKTLLKEPSAVITSNVTSRPSSRHKRHIEGILSNKSANIERKTRKRRTLDRTGSVEYDTKLPSVIRGNTDDDFASKIKSIEEGWQSKQLVEKKPKDLMRKIGKIETSDWNIKEIEKKIKENKLGKPIVRDKEKVPKWSREQFVARQTKLEKLDRQDSAEAKYADIDKNIKHLDLKLKEGTNRDLGQNKIASITEKLTSKIPEPQEPVIPKSVDKPVIIPSYSGSEFCHFCNKRVYLMERLSAEGRFFHHGCFKCQYCKAQLRLGSYAFDKDGIYGHKFFCLHHYGMQGKAPSTTKVARKPSQRDTKPTSKKLTGISGVDLLDRVRTPERAEFANLSRGSSDQEDSVSQMDEDEWTDRNFGASTAEIGSSDDDDSSSYSDTDSDDEDAYEEAMEEPATKEGTLKWAERMSKRHYSKQDKSDSEPYGSTDSSSYYENSSDDDESDTATEGEEEIRARELRLQEVRLEPPIIQADTGTDTEVKCNIETSDNLHLSHSEYQSSDPRLSTNSSSNSSVNSTDFDSALEDNIDINFNNLISKSELTAPTKHSCIDSEEDSATTISKSDTNSNITVIERTLDKKADNSNCNIDETNKPCSSETSESLSNKETWSQVNNLNGANNILNSQPEVSNKEHSVDSTITMSNKFFGREFIPKFQSDEPEPLLVIKRTPSKINLPVEVGKPRVAVNKNIEETAKKYFGSPPKTLLRRSSTLKCVPIPQIKKRSNSFQSRSLKSHFSFNFEPEEEDLQNTDDYIENLMRNEEELMKPIDPNQFKELDKELDKNEKCDSIDDLLEAFEMETSEDVFESSGIKRTDDKIGHLLKWMDEVDHQEDNVKVLDVLEGDIGKYENLEMTLKAGKSAAPVTKLAKNNIKYFDELLAGKNSPADDEVQVRKFSWSRQDASTNLSKQRASLDLDAIKKVDIKKVLKKFESMDYNSDDDSIDKSNPSIDDLEHMEKERKKPSLTRSKTEIHFNKPRSSIDLEAVSKVDIRQVLKKFESVEKSDDSPLPPRKRSSSFANFKKATTVPKNTKTDQIKEKLLQKPPSVPKGKIKGDGFLGKEYHENTQTTTEKEQGNISITADEILSDNYFNMQVKVNYEQYPIESINSSDSKIEINSLEENDMTDNIKTKSPKEWNENIKSATENTIKEAEQIHEKDISEMNNVSKENTNNSESNLKMIENNNNDSNPSNLNKNNEISLNENMNILTSVDRNEEQGESLDKSQITNENDDKSVYDQIEHDFTQMIGSLSSLVQKNDTYNVENQSTPKRESSSEKNEIIHKEDADILKSVIVNTTKEIQNLSSDKKELTEIELKEEDEKIHINKSEENNVNLDKICHTNDKLEYEQFEQDFNQMMGSLTSLAEKNNLSNVENQNNPKCEFSEKNKTICRENDQFDMLKNITGNISEEKQDLENNEKELKDHTNGNSVYEQIEQEFNQMMGSLTHLDEKNNQNNVENQNDPKRESSLEKNETIRRENDHIDILKNITEKAIEEKQDLGDDEKELPEIELKDEDKKTHIKSSEENNARLENTKHTNGNSVYDQIEHNLNTMIGSLNNLAEDSRIKTFEDQITSESKSSLEDNEDTHIEGNTISLMQENINEKCELKTKEQDSIQTEIKNEEKNTNYNNSSEKFKKIQDKGGNLAYDQMEHNLNEIIGSLNDHETSDIEFGQSSASPNEKINTLRNNLDSSKHKTNTKNADISSTISSFCDDKSSVSDKIKDSDKSVSNEHSPKTNLNAPPVPVRNKNAGKGTPPPQRPQRKRSLEQRNKESVERTRYVPTEEKLRNLDRIKKERIIMHQSPKGQKGEVHNLNTNTEEKDKDCSIQ